VKRHRPASSIAKGLRSLITEPPTRKIRPSFIPTSNTKCPPTPVIKDSSWDVVDDLPLRWATDFTSLSSTGSRISNTSVVSYALWHEGSTSCTRRALLAVATKTNIFLYETPRGERAFHFVKVCIDLLMFNVTTRVFAGVLHAIPATLSHLRPAMCTRYFSITM
jgi:hypothetical protein